jgi:hypothetical protein
VRSEETYLQSKFRNLKNLARTSVLSWALLCLQINATVATEPFSDAILGKIQGRNFLALSSDALNAIELAKKEALKQNLKPDQMSLVSVLFEQDNFVVSFGPPYSGGLDGPEFRVVVRRSDFKVLLVANHSEVSANKMIIKDIVVPVEP